MRPVSRGPFSMLAIAVTLGLAMLTVSGCSSEIKYTCHAMATGQESEVKTYRETTAEEAKSLCEDDFPGRTCSCSEQDSNPVSVQ